MWVKCIVKSERDYTCMLPTPEEPVIMGQSIAGRREAVKGHYCLVSPGVSDLTQILFIHVCLGSAAAYSVR